MRGSELDARVTAFLTRERVAFLVGAAVGMVVAGIFIGVMTGELSIRRLIPTALWISVFYAVLLLRRRRQAKTSSAR